jgi:hypothetical protein
MDQKQSNMNMGKQVNISRERMIKKTKDKLGYNIFGKRQQPQISYFCRGRKKQNFEKYHLIKLI